jgi:hypothetical protein
MPTLYSSLCSGLSLARGTYQPFLGLHGAWSGMPLRMALMPADYVRSRPVVTLTGPPDRDQCSSWTAAGTRWAGLG